MPQLDVSSIQALRPRLVRLAYRMLGSVAEAEDVVQEAWIRYQRSDAEVDRPEAFLARTVSRLALDALKSARKRRETYVGPWLPEPIFDAQETVADDVTLSLMLALERLSPLERATFLLHDVFGMELDEVASALEREPAACRKLATRAREHVRQARPRYQVSSEQGAEIAHAFYVAARDGDVSALRQLLAEDVVLYSDGGGRRSAATKPVEGASRVERFFYGIAKKAGFTRAAYYEPMLIDGLPGFITLADDGLPQTTALGVVDGRIRAIYQIRNPDKLQRVLVTSRRC